ncbi:MULTISPECIES: hypothetical protein [Streptomyces]|uniref:hypothetical protein n=1 Tax=Streptomyces TaxID=1883 RepID=UPI0015C517E0|nr:MULTISPECIES: hypothetical protein [Streptomyces]WUD30701.1 hypothetical protein OG858_04325 [Streptomyces europaeiscabiei]
MLTIAVAGVLLGAGVAWAAVTDNLVPTGNHNPSCSEPGIFSSVTVCQTNNGSVYYNMDSSGEYELEAGDKDIVRDMLASQYSSTDLAIYYDSNPTFSGDAETDIIYQEGSTDIPDDADGFTWCNDDSPAAEYECDQQYIRIRGAGSYTPGLSCHETGHAVGLLHGDDASPQLLKTNSALGCMQTPVDYCEPLGDNQADNINAHYIKPN